MPATAVRPKVRFARFILHKHVASRRYLYKIRTPTNAKGKLKPGFVQSDAALRDRLIESNGDKESLLFRSFADPTAKVHDVVYITSDPEMAEWVRKEIREGRLRAREDISVMPQVCPWCAMEGKEFILPSSTEPERVKMYEHILELHPERVEGNIGQVIEAVA